MVFHLRSLWVAENLEAKRIAKPHEVIYGSSGQAEAHVKIHLLLGCNLIRRSKMQYMLRATALRKIARVLHEGIPWFCELTI